MFSAAVLPPRRVPGTGALPLKQTLYVYSSFRFCPHRFIRQHLTISSIWASGATNIQFHGDEFLTQQNTCSEDSLKVKQSRYTPWRRLGESYSSYLFFTSALDGGGRSALPVALYPRGKDPRYPLDWRLGWPQNRCGHRG
jgi:hypothetical protein